MLTLTLFVQLIAAALALTLAAIAGLVVGEHYRATHPPHGLSIAAWTHWRVLRDGQAAWGDAAWRAKVDLVLALAGVTVVRRTDATQGVCYTSLPLVLVDGGDKAAGVPAAGTAQRPIIRSRVVRPRRPAGSALLARDGAVSHACAQREGGACDVSRDV